LPIVSAPDKMRRLLVNPSSEIVWTCGWVLLAIAGITAFATHSCRADKIIRPEAWQFERADVDTIRMHTRQILSEPDLAPRKTFWQWLTEKFSKWDKPDLRVGSGWSKLIWSIFVVWAILTLVAILIHALWTVRVLIWPGGPHDNATVAPGSESVKITSFEELYEMARTLAEKEAFCEAISVMMVAMLRLLDSIGIVRFHESKTNGDYIREYPPSLISRNEFKKFVLTFEQVVYGRFNCDRQTYWQMNSLMEHIHNGVSQKA
jgi:hypothetical protein